MYRSLILAAAARLLVGLILMFSFFLLLRGHNEPGGGFAGGLVASIAFALYTIAYGVAGARQALLLEPRNIAAIGLCCALYGGLLSMVLGHPFLTSLWFSFYFSAIDKVTLSTPLLFDLGVYLVVLGTVMSMIFALEEEV